MGEQLGRAEWMSGRWGLMVHWIPPGPAREQGPWVADLDAAVDAFDLDRFMGQFAATGADWLVFTIGQNSACYCSPNRVLDRLCGPGHASRRDLISELADAVTGLGKRFIAYLPAETKAPTSLHAGFAWKPSDQREFEQRYCAFIAEYAERLGSRLAGWWFDGCYTWPDFHNDVRDWALWAKAARAGNPDAALAFNDGSLCCGIGQPLTPHQDYLAGEIELLRDGRLRYGREDNSPFVLPTAKYLEGTDCLWHGLVPIDCFWGHDQPGPMEPPRYSDECLTAFVRSCTRVGGAVTLNVGIYQEGHLADATVAQVRTMVSALTG
ncbi:MAG: hypothetical protein HZB16_07590 [Armatimonadetes bacterium]|nr:hypothetical protein [Armatimonadota bacterium]